MVLQTRLSVSHTQNLALTPALRASIELLQLSLQDLEAFVASKAEENPLLDHLEAPLRGERFTATRSGFDPLAERLADSPSLAEHLQCQAALLFTDRLDAVLAGRFIEELDEVGYLRATPEDIADEHAVSPERALAVLGRLQGLEPSGLFARDLRECLALQLAARGRLTGFMQDLLDGLQVLADKGAQGLASALGVPVERVERGFREIRGLDPKPALSFEPTLVVPLVPDLVVSVDAKGRFQIAINPETVPQIRLDREVQSSLLPRLRTREERSYLSEQAQEVAWLRRALSRRFETLLRVGQAILARQGDYFERGPAALKPLTRRSLAESLGLSEATISRVVANKYLISPRGTEPLKRFFSASLGTNGEISAVAAQERLRQLVAAEPSSKPLSDSALAARLADGGLPVARRTVAKYRDLLRIPAAADRRRSNQHR
ncbi:MAG: RNA polymerase factor sigma-54 [Kiloniellales bacterium]